MRNGKPHAARYPHHRRHSRLCGEFVCHSAKPNMHAKVCAHDFMIQCIFRHVFALIALFFVRVYAMAQVWFLLGAQLLHCAACVFSLPHKNKSVWAREHRLRCCNRNKFCMCFFPRLVSSLPTNSHSNTSRRSLAPEVWSLAAFCRLTILHLKVAKPLGDVWSETGQRATPTRPKSQCPPQPNQTTFPPWLKPFEPAPLPTLSVLSPVRGVKGIGPQRQLQPTQVANPEI